MTRTLGLRFSLIAAITCLAALTHAQSPAFGVASVKSSASATNRWRVGADCPDGTCIRFVATNASLRMLIDYAYPSLRPNEIVGGPGWIDTARFEVEGKPDAADGRTTRPQLQLMLRTLLEDRFALKTHLERQQLPIYNLIVATRDRLKIQRADDQTPPLQLPPPTDPPGRGSALIKAETQGSIASGRAVPIPTLISLVQGLADRRLFDRTNLQGLFDFDLRFTPETTIAPQASASDASAFPSLSTAIAEQLGLKLESARGPVDVLVIESVRRPTEN